MAKHTAGEHVTTSMDTAAYLRRIGHWSGVDTDLSTLRSLTRAHLMSVPFENLDIHLGQPIALDVDRFFRKIVNQRRGGFCYELNGLFAELLRELGFHVQLMSARVERKSGELGPHGDHLALKVFVGGDAYLVDVGFGDSPRTPMKLEPGSVVRERGLEFRLRDATDGLRFEAQAEGGRKKAYQLGTRPRALSFFRPMSDYHQKSPMSFFTQQRLCTMPTREGRTSLYGETLAVYDGESTKEHRVDGDGAFLEALSREFGVNIASAPKVVGRSLPMRLSRRALDFRQRAQRAISRLRTDAALVTQ